MINKALIILIIIFVAFAIIDSFSLMDEVMVTYSLTLAEFAAVLMMIINGTFKKRRYFKLIYLISTCIIVGVMFKIMHYAGADEILLVSLLAMPVIYSIHFITKKEKKLLDVLKLLSVISYFIIALLILHRSINSDDRYLVAQAPHLLFWITFLYFLVIRWRERRLFKA